MANITNRTITTILLICLVFTSFSQKLGFQEVLDESPNRITTFCVPINKQNFDLLDKEGIHVKYTSDQWAFISTTPSWINEKIKSNELSDYYFEFAPPSLLSDTARAHHFVNDVHAGMGGLNSPYTGKNVIMGYVDTGIEVDHEDFLDANGNTRVIRYWDQTMPDNSSSPQPYGYGYAWDSTEINNNSITSVDNSAHGSSVAGQGSGDGSANGSNKGMAPDCAIIMVESDFSRPNWTLTVADACDYIFKVADTLGLPAVVNLSVGTYFGSHDGNDPAAVVIENLLDEKPGRIVVAAAGNSGAKGRHHQQGNPTSDTNFVWFVNVTWAGANPIFGLNTVFFDLWADSTDATWDFAMGANYEGPEWYDRGSTSFHGATSSIGTTIYDTLWNNGNQLLTYEVYTEYVGSNYHMQLLAHIDSVGMRYRFETTGSGKYDLWSGEWLRYNNQYWSAPPLSEFPDSIYYVGPDTLQSIVSSWNCSEKVVSVGNMRNRFSYIDNNQNPYVSADPTPVGALSPNSSKGPSRHNLIKPDVTAAGDVSLGPGPLWFLTAPVNNALIDSGGMHVRNGGTSMAAPVVAGIAALYLERCGKATYQDFLDDLTSNCYTDQFTGTVPNNAYGYGKPNALNTLLQVTPPTPPTITSDFNDNLFSSVESNYEWFLDGAIIAGETNQSISVTPPYGTYQVMTTNPQGCTAFSDPFVVTLEISKSELNGINAYPNPTQSILHVNSEYKIQSLKLFSHDGSEVNIQKINESSYSLEACDSGTYILTIETFQGIFHSKIIRL